MFTRQVIRHFDAGASQTVMRQAAYKSHHRSR